MGSTGGNDFPGVSRPFGMVKIGPDNIDGKLNAYSGYLPHGAHTGFSMMHLSGIGGVPTYGVISQLPVIGDVVPSVPRRGADTAQVGYYKSHTAQGVAVELGASEHAALYQYTFPQGGGSVMVDLSHRLPSFRGQRLEQGFAGGNVSVEGERYEGSGTYNGGYNRAPDWTVYFCMYGGLFGGCSADVTGRWLFRSSSKEYRDLLREWNRQG
jgi:putative alpha-1,2-mannosidase